MCRIRPASSAALGQSGGLNITFQLEDDMQECELHLSASTQGNLINFIAVPSPTMVGAFRYCLVVYQNYVNKNKYYAFCLALILF